MIRPSASDKQEIQASGLFDAAWYVRAYRDVALLAMDPVEHFLRVGAALGRSPGPGFDTRHYTSSNPDVATGGHNPLLHYLRYGRLEGRSPVPPRTMSAPGHVPPAGVAARVAARAAERVWPGKRGRRPGARTVLVCAHVAGERLFGGERSLLDILDAFGRSDIDTVVSVPGQPAKAYLAGLLERTTAVHLVSQAWWRDARSLDLDVVARFAGLIGRESIDAVHVNTIMLPEPLESARAMGVPAVVHVRELVAHDLALRETIGLDAEQIIAAVAARCDAVIANSRATAKDFSDRRPCFVVPNMVDLERFELPRPAQRAGLRVGMISSNLPKKGLAAFVEVARELQARRVPVTMVLVGPETDAVLALRGAGGLPANVELAGYRDDPVDAIAELDVVVSLSEFQESFGRTVLEAMAGGRPVVVYDWGALPELVEDATTGFIVGYRDTQAIVERIQALVADPQRLVEMGCAGRRRAEAGYGLGHGAQLLADAYSRIWAGWQPARLTHCARELPVPVDPGRPLRIAYFLWWFPAPSETFVLNELRELVAAGHDVEVYCRQSPFPDFVPDFEIRWTQVVDADALAQALSASRREIVHSHFVYPTVTDMVWPACEQSGVDFTFIAHAQDIFRYANDAKNRIGEIAHSARCRRVIVPSRFHRDYLLERGVPRGKLFINPNGMDPDLYGSTPEYRPRAQGQVRSICAVHRFTEKKGLEHLIRAAPHLPGIDVHIYGYGDLEADYRELARELDASNVHIHGPVKGRQALLEVFSQHDLFACPSVRASDGDMDGIPTVVMEAMAAGLPVMVTPLSGIPELVSDGVNGLYCEPDAVSIAGVVHRFFDMPDAERAALVDAARHTVENGFNTPRLVAGLVRLWRNQTIDVMIVSWNNLPQLAEVVHRLQANTTLPWHLIICDNGSQSDVTAWLVAAHAQYANLTVIFNRENALVGPGTNRCLAAGTSDYAVYVCGKEGFTLEQGWERPLVEFMDRHVDVGQAGTLAYSPTYLSGRDYPAGVREYPAFRDRDFVEANPDRRFGHVQGGFFVLRRDMVDAIGGFSDDVPHDYTDVEYSLHAEANRWRLGEAPGMLALYNKTRPDLFSRIDETMLALHPPTLEQLPLLDSIAARSVRFCNVCAWSGEAFAEGQACPGCGSRPSDRSLYRFLAESTLVHRRLLGLALGVGPSLDGIWRAQFRGDVVPAAALGRDALGAVAPTRLDGRVDVIYVDADAVSGPALPDVFDAVARLLSNRGVVAVRFGRHHPAEADEQRAIDELSRRVGGPPPDVFRYRSEVVRYDLRRLWLLRKSDIPQCVY